MTRLATKTSLLLGVAVLALTACGGSGKGPGSLGSKNDIVVRNNGLPGAVAPIPPSAEGEISSTVEQAEAVPAPEVAQAPLEMPPESPAPVAEPAVEQEASRIAQEQSPVASAAAAPINDDAGVSTLASTDPVSSDVLPEEPIASAQPLPAPASEVDHQEVTPEPAAPAIEAPAQEVVSAPVVHHQPAPVTKPVESANNIAPVQASDNTYVSDDAPAAAIAALNAKRLAEAQAAPQEQVPAPVVVPETAPAVTQVASEVYDVTAQVASTPVSSVPAAPVSPSSVYPAEDYPAQSLVQENVQSQTSTVDPSIAIIVPPQGIEIIPPAGVPSETINFLDPSIIKLAQDSLKRKGAYNGPKDGVVNTKYLNALSKYQADNKLPQGGLNAETLRHLGVLQ